MLKTTLFELQFKSFFYNLAIKQLTATSEKGHAKNIANANLLNTYIAQLGTLYNPSNPKLQLSNLQNIYTTSFSHQESVNTLVAPYSIAVDNRENIFAPISKKITKLRKAYKATEGVTPAQLEDFMTIARKLKGIRKVTNARSIRNNSMYLSEDNLVDTFNKAKDYLFTILDSNSVQYKAIAKIKFKKV